MAGADIGRTGVDELAIDLVGEEIEIVLLHKVANLIHLATGVEVARRVVGVTYKYRARALINEFFELLHLGQREALFDGRRDGAYDGAGRDGKCHIVGIGRFWHDNLVARVQAREEREEHGLRTAAGDDDIIGRDVDIVLRIVVDQLLAIAEVALRRRIFEYRAVDTSNGVEGSLRRGKVGLTDIEVVHFYAALLCSVGQRSQLADRRSRHLNTSNRYLGHMY